MESVENLEMLRVNISWAVHVLREPLEFFNFLFVIVLSHSN